MKTCKIVFTGGPCGGKTESINFFIERLARDKKSYKVCKETARSLLSIGYMPNSNISAYDFQNLLLKIQFLKEYQRENKSEVLLCDRGLLDGKVYLGDDEFSRLLKENNLSESDILLTYDAALYFRTIAYEYPNLFKNKRIYETPEVGIERDIRCQEIWKDKILTCNYSNLEGFDLKKEKLYKLLIDYLMTFDETKSFSLNDFYGEEYIDFMSDGIESVMKENNVPEDIKVKTRRLIK